jgi:chromosome segregation protein
MTRLLSLEMQGFKSFAHKTRLDLKQGLNVVVGPNGAGKSNIMDALCFVLGKTKKKELRAERLSHLIFNGGKGRKPMEFAKAVLTLENNGEFPLKTKEVRISRAVNKEGNSIFRINGQRSNLAEVLSLLKAVNVDTEGFNIILQGEINKFVDMSTVQRRQIIDDVSGVSFYEEKKKKSIDELDKVEEKTKEKRIVLAEKEKYLKELLKDKEYAEDFIAIRDKLRMTKAKIVFKKKEAMEKERDRRKAEIESIEKKKKVVEERTKKDNGEYERTEREIGEVEEELGRKGQEKERELRDKMEKTGIDVQKSENKVENYKKEIGGMKERLRQILSEIKENQVGFSEANRDMNRIAKEIKQVEEAIKEKNEFTKRYSPYEIKKKVVVLENETSAMEKKLEDMREREKVIRDCSSSMKRILGRKDALAKSIGKKTEEMRGFGSKADEIDEYIKHLHKQRTDLEIKLRNFMSSLSRGTKAIMGVQHPGIIGNIMELIEYPESMSAAINSLAGSRRNIIVVDNEDTAIWCINFLKREKAGTATFLPKSRISETKLRENKIEGVISRAIDVVRYDERFKNVVQWLLGDSLIIKDLEVSKRIKGFRMATPEGDIVEKSGTFSGGYRRNIMGPNKAEIDEKLEKISSEIKRYETYLDSLEKEIDTKREEISEADSEVRELEKSETEQRVRLENAGKVSTNEILKIDMELKEKKAELSELRKVKEDEEFERVSKEAEELQKRSNSLLVEESTLKMKAGVFEQDVEKLQKIRAGLEKDEEKFQKMLAQEERELDSQKKLLKDMKKEQEKFFSRIKDLYEKRAKMKKRLDVLNSRINEGEKKAYRLEQDKQKVELAKAATVARIEGLRKEYEEFEDIKLERVHESVEDLDTKVNSLEKRIEKFGPVNMKALETYNDVKEEYDKMISKIEMLEKERSDIITKMEEIEKEKTGVFMKAFESVGKTFKRIYFDLAEGEAMMILENVDSPFDGGMELVVRPKGKRPSTLKALSGGEKTIVAIAFILSIQEYAPAPFYIFDEIDAALDKVNSQKLARTLKESSEKSQIIIITHNDEIVANADYLYGISINKEGVSKVVSIKLP